MRPSWSALPALVAAINGYWVKAARSPEVTSRLTNDGNDVVAGTPAEATAMLTADGRKWGEVVRRIQLGLD